MQKTVVAGLLALAALGAGGVASAAVEGERGGEVGILVGAVATDENLSMQSGGTVEPLLGVRGGSVFARRFTWFLDMVAARVSTAGSPLGDALTYWGRTGFEVFLRPEQRGRWFVGGGAGWMLTDFESSGSADFNRPFVSGGLGQRWVLSPGVQLRWEVRGDITVGDDGLAEETVGQGLLVAGLVWGPPSSGAPRQSSAPADGDGDGIKDGRDRCAGTPAGAEVTRDGCPVDDDRDGVPNGIDRCPGSHHDRPIDATGCTADSDHDGVTDATDACAATPAGVPVDDWGCPTDRDRDGVMDGLDRCPGTAVDIVVDDAGCPQDTDRDGVPDGLDRCPETAPDAQVGPSGCPDVGFEFDRENEVLLVWFDFEAGRARIDPTAEGMLDGIYEVLETTPGRFEVGGHADATGDTPDPVAISLKRAEAVYDRLVARGIDPARLEVRGYGATRPLVPGVTEQERRQNRRVELRMIETPAP